MSVAEMREWAAAGNEVGSHTLDHVHLPRVSADVARHQIVQSKAELEDILGAPVTAFCYPYGDNDAAHRAMVREAGYDNATLTKRGLARPADDPYGLPRVLVAGSTPLLRFLMKTLTSYEERRRRT
jgi:peptidoglycan/xylan/chitin deacetylase (PgdA/CDA1 family)